MLADLVEVEKGLFQALDKRRHTTQGSTLQLLALEQTLGVLCRELAANLDAGFRNI